VHLAQAIKPNDKPRTGPCETSTLHHTYNRLHVLSFDEWALDVAMKYQRYRTNKSETWQKPCTISFRKQTFTQAVLFFLTAKRSPIFCFKCEFFIQFIFISIYLSYTAYLSFLLLPSRFCLSYFLTIFLVFHFIYIYIYICVCVCVYMCMCLNKNVLWIVYFCFKGLTHF
jgi:hypothetical protein